VSRSEVRRRTNVSQAGDKRRQNPATKMPREEADRLRELLRSTKPLDLYDQSIALRIGMAVSRAHDWPPERNW
jgi:hypothetical protein